MLEETLEFGARTRAQRGNATMLDYHPSTIIVSVFNKVANARKCTDALLKDCFNHTNVSRVAAI